MGKNHRHKKALKADKAKTKLKQTKTKFLPKGQNVTNTTFKVKPIVLREQLKEKDKTAPLSKRKLDVKDLLSRMRHYNENIRQIACEDLSDMLKQYSEELGNHHLSQIIPIVGALMQDREVKVRRAVTKVIAATLSSIPEAKLVPYYKYFQVNLRCTMTNIDRNIQEDSLTFLEVFLKQNSTVIFGDPGKFLPDFFMLISKLRTSDNVGLTLTMNLESRISSIVWRIKVMSHLGKILEQIMAEPRKLEGKDGPIYSDGSCNTPLYRTRFGEVLGSTDWNLSGTQDLRAIWENHLVKIIPLLCDTLMEVMPDQRVDKTINDSTHLQEVTSVILYIVVSIFTLLHNYSKNYNLSWESEDFVKTMQHLATNFPYHFKGKGSEIKKMHVALPEINHAQFNLMLCSLCLPLFVSRRNTKDLNRMMEYLNKCLLDKKVTFQKSELLISNLKSIFQNFKVYLKISPGSLKVTIENTITFFNNLKNEDITMKCFDMLINLHDKQFVINNKGYKLWLESLPDLLSHKEISKQNVEMLLKASKMNINDFHNGLVQKLPNILHKLEEDIGKGVFGTEYIQLYLPMIFLFVAELSESDLRLINEFIVKHQSTTYAVNFKKMVDWRSELIQNSEVKHIQYY